MNGQQHRPGANAGHDEQYRNRPVSFKEWLFQPILLQLEILMSTQAEMAQQINAVADGLGEVKAQLAKATTEITGSIADLRTAISDAGNSTPDMDAAMARLTASKTALAEASQTLDDLTPDPVVVEPPAPAPAPSEPTDPNGSTGGEGSSTATDATGTDTLGL